MVDDTAIEGVLNEVMGERNISDRERQQLQEMGSMYAIVVETRMEGGEGLTLDRAREMIRQKLGQKLGRVREMIGPYEKHEAEIRRVLVELRATHLEQAFRDGGILVRIARELEMREVLYRGQRVQLEGRAREWFIRRRILDAMHTKPPGLDMPPVEDCGDIRSPALP